MRKEKKGKGEWGEERKKREDKIKILNAIQSSLNSCAKGGVTGTHAYSAAHEKHGKARLSGLHRLLLCELLWAYRENFPFTAVLWHR